MIPTIEAELCFYDGVGSAICFAIDSDNKVYTPCNLEAYVHPFNSDAKFKLFTDDKILVWYILQHSEVNYAR